MGLFDEKDRGTKDEQIGNLETLAAKRKQKLLGLKKGKKFKKDEENDDVQNEEEDKEELPTSQVLFRTYKPTNDELQDLSLPRAQPIDVEEMVQDQIEDGKKANDVADVEISNLAPKKITFDLRRGIQAHLDKLDKRTDKAIAELIRQRLKEGIQQDFLMAVNAGAIAQKKDSYGSDDED